MSTRVEPTNAIVAPSARERMSPAAAERVECPDGYSGKGGVATIVVNFASNTRWTYVTGRTTSDRYFSFQQPTNASAIASEVNAYSSAAWSADSRRRATRWLTTLTQSNPGVPGATGGW